MLHCKKAAVYPFIITKSNAFIRQFKIIHSLFRDKSTSINLNLMSENTGSDFIYMPF